MKHIVIVSVIAALVGTALVAAGTRYRDAMNDLAAYDGTALGASREEVLYRFGTPSSVLGPEETAGLKPSGWSSYRIVFDVDPATGKINGAASGKKIDDFDAWSYRRPLGSSADVTVSFTSGRVHSISCVDFSKAATGCRPILGVRLGSTEERVRQRLGRPGKESFVGAGVKEMDYERLGLKILLSEGTVYSVERQATPLSRGAVFLVSLSD